MTDQSTTSVGNRSSLCLLGASLETSNRGVSALAAAGSKLMSQHFTPCDLTLLVSARRASERRTLLGEEGTITVKVVNYSRGPRNGLRNSAAFALLCALVLKFLPCGRIRQRIVSKVPLLCSLEKSVLVADLFAGDSLSDIYGLPRLFFSAMPRWCALLLGKPFVLLPQTYGPFKSRVAQRIAASLVDRAAMVFARTKDDSALRKLPLKRPLRVKYCPDVAFMLDADSSFSCMAHFDDDDCAAATTVTVGLNVSGLLYNGGYSGANMFELRLDYVRFVHELVAELLATSRVHVLLVPHTYSSARLNDVENDLGACLKVAAVFPAQQNRVRAISEELDQHQIKGVIGGCDFFVGSRLHSCIAALSQGIVTVGVGYSKKFVETFSTVGMEDLVIDGRIVGHAPAVERVLKLIEQRDRYQARLKAGVEQNQETIHRSFELIRQTMTPSSVASAGYR